MNEPNVGKVLQKAAKLLEELDKGVFLDLDHLDHFVVRVHRALRDLLDAAVSEGLRKEKHRATSQEALQSVETLTNDLTLALQMLTERHALQEFSERQQRGKKPKRLPDPGIN